MGPRRTESGRRKTKKARTSNTTIQIRSDTAVYFPARKKSQTLPFFLAYSITRFPVPLTFSTSYIAARQFYVFTLRKYGGAFNLYTRNVSQPDGLGFFYIIFVLKLINLIG